MYALTFLENDLLYTLFSFPGQDITNDDITNKKYIEEFMHM